jgi:pimeloyl-ACP methyl ester carboxylesterase
LVWFAAAHDGASNVATLACQCLYSTFTPFHRGGSGSPLVCLHGFLDTWRTWELVLPALERRHDTLALTLAGRAGGPAIDGAVDGRSVADAVELAMDEAGFDTAHVLGSSLGGYVALQLAARGRAETVVALAPAGGWAPEDESYRDLLAFQRALRDQARVAAPHVDAIVASREGRRRATQVLSVNFEHIPAELIAHQLVGVASCPAADELIEYALREGWTLDAEQITCPVRIVWGARDEVLPWPRAAARYRDDSLPHADWVLLEDAGHYPQLDVPLEASQLVLGFTSIEKTQAEDSSAALSAGRSGEPNTTRFRVAT